MLGSNSVFMRIFSPWLIQIAAIAVFCLPALLYFFPSADIFWKLNFVFTLAIISCLAYYNKNGSTYYGRWCAAWAFVSVTSWLVAITIRLLQQVPTLGELLGPMFCLSAGFCFYALIRVQKMLDER